MNSRQISTTLLLLLAATGVVVACRPDTEVESGITGIDLSLSFSPNEIDQIQVRGWIGTGGTQAFLPGIVPSPPALLTSGLESVAILLSDSRGDAILMVRADGLRNGEVVATKQDLVRTIRKAMVPMSLFLGDLPECYDGTDNDLDGFTDFGSDPGCTTEFDDAEDDNAPPPTPVPTPTPEPTSSSPTPTPTLTPTTTATTS